MAHKIAGILFDIGGVLVALDGVPSMAKLLGVEPRHEALHAMWVASPSVVAHETGKMEAAAFAVSLVAEFGLPIAADGFLQEFCDWPTGVLLPASEVVFLDDGLRNVEAAAKLGMQAHRARGPEEARRVLAQYGVVRNSP